MPKDIAEQLSDLADLPGDQFKLTDWEIDFVESVTKQLERGGTLTSNQTKVIDKLWDMVFIHGKREKLTCLFIDM